MDTLENYLATDYLKDRQEIDDIERSLKDLMATFEVTFDAKNGWPYDFRTDMGKGAAKHDKSQGTLCMVLSAAGRGLGRCALPKRTFAKSTKDDFPLLKEHWDSGLKLLLTAVARGVRSGTFGKDNPLTLSFLCELRDLLNPSTYGRQKESLSTKLTAAAAELKKRLVHDIATQTKLLVLGGATGGNSENRYLVNAFVPLRALRAAHSLNIKPPPKSQFRGFFETRLHQQLSFSSIPDSRFDPAELIFSLEGLLLCAREAVDGTLFNRVLQVLEQEQNSSAHWRPNKPFIATPQGMILLPISVEGANSLMRSIEMVDRGKLYDTVTERSLPLIRRFWRWIRARGVVFDSRVGGKTIRCIGWHSEHVNDPHLIHLWDTSQVAEFMIFFKEMIERHVANNTLRLSRLTVKPPARKGANAPRDRRWRTIAKDFEPRLGASSDDRLYDWLERDFVNGWAEKNPANYSMLLYGPPGTGKTSVAENLAGILDMNLITVTVSDFLGSGGEQVEARAKAIFQTLEAQENVAILFDEIDSFLLDRDSKLYSSQSTLFQFLTPGMLTKLQDLRNAKRSIFVIATNYANRIDSAIKRTGRIDRQYLVSLPDRARRAEVLLLDRRRTPKNEAILRKTLFFGYKDLESARKEAGGNVDRLLVSVEKREPSTTLESYLKRLDSKEEEVFPGAEFYSLVLLADEVGMGESVRAGLSPHAGNADSKKKLFMGLDDEQKKRLQQYLRPAAKGKNKAKVKKKKK